MVRGHLQPWAHRTILASPSTTTRRCIVADIHGPQRLGPLTQLVGDWEGNVGIDLSYHNKDDETGRTGYFEKAWFHPIPVQENGKQSLECLIYKMTAWRH